MATSKQSPSSTEPTDACQVLVEQLSDAKTEKDLFKITLSTEFRSAVFPLSAADKKYLADHYAVINKLLSGKVKLDEIDGETVTITGIRHDFSTTYDNNFVVITGTRENGNKFTALSSAVRVVRFCEKVDAEGRLPVQAIFTKKPHDDGKTMWYVREIRNSSSVDNSKLPWEN